jgi:hypothetical protein
MFSNSGSWIREKSAVSLKTFITPSVLTLTCSRCRPRIVEGHVCNERWNRSLTHADLHDSYLQISRSVLLHIRTCRGSMMKPKEILESRSMYVLAFINFPFYPFFIAHRTTCISEKWFCVTLWFGTIGTANFHACQLSCMLIRDVLILAISCTYCFLIRSSAPTSRALLTNLHIR